MMSFRGEKVLKQSLAAGTGWLLADLGEHKGVQRLYARQSPQVLRTLREHALIQSAESSNRIEGVTVAKDRLAPLVLGNTRPRDRNEEEVRGYREALNLIHSNWKRLEISAATIRQLHATIHAGTADAGEWKRRDNDIIELRPAAEPVVRFRTLPAEETDAAINELCQSYEHLLSQAKAAPLVCVAAFVLDFLCIHPFRDGNGRTGRLLSLLTLYHQGYEVGRYISLERLIEDSKEDYYETLQRSSNHWHEGQHDLKPWTNYFLGIVRHASLEFEKQVNALKTAPGAKSKLVRESIAAQLGPFTLASLEQACPGVSRDTIRQVLRELQSLNMVECLGRGPGAQWRNKGITSKRG
jgi:Fic family protein